MNLFAAIGGRCVQVNRCRCNVPFVKRSGRALQAVDAMPDVLQPPQHRLQRLHAQSQFFDQPRGLARPDHQPPPGFAPFGERVAFVYGDCIIGAVLPQQGLHRVQIWRETPEEGTFLPGVGRRHFDRALQTHRAVANLFQK